MRKFYFLFIFFLLIVLNNANAEINYFYTKLGTASYREDLKIDTTFFNNFITSFSINTEGPKDCFNFGFGFVFNKNFDYFMNFDFRNYEVHISKLEFQPFFPQIGKIKPAELKLFTTSFNFNYLLKNRTIFTPYLGFAVNLTNTTVTIAKKTKSAINTTYGYRLGLQTKIFKKVHLDLNLQQNSKLKLIHGDLGFGNIKLMSVKSSLEESMFNTNIMISF